MHEQHTQTLCESGLMPAAACEVMAMLDPRTAAHPDFHDGWTALRARRMPLARAEPQHRTRITVTDADARRLDNVLRRLACDVDPDQVAALRAELRRANIVNARAIPAHVVTMNSHVLCEHELTKDRAELKLVYPAYAWAPAGQLSVLTPLGTALLGAAIGEHLNLPPSTTGPRTRRLLPPGPVRIHDLVYQPERAGHFHL